MSDKEETTRPFILIVEDEPELAKGIQICLQDQFDTAIAEDALVALDILANRRPALITLDINMPKMSGLEFLQKANEKQYLQGVRIILISGMPAEELMAGLVSGADWVMEKPFDFLKVKAKVEELLR